MLGLGLGAASRRRGESFRRAASDRWVLYTIFIFLLSPVGHVTADPPLKIYLNADRNTNPQLTREQLREIYFVRQTKWPDGTPVRVFVLPDQHPLHIRFTKEILGVYPYQLRSAWDRMVYSGTGVAPTVVDNSEEMHSRVNGTPGAIGYVEE